MITQQFTDLSTAQRAALETLLAEQMPGGAQYAPRNAPTWSVEDVLDLENRGLLEYDSEVGTRVTAAGAQLVVDLAYDAAVAVHAARRASTGRHALRPGAESTLERLGIVVASSRTDVTEVLDRVDEPEPEWPTETGELADEPGFIETFPEAAVEHTAELEAIAVEGPLRRFGRWFVRNLTGTRVTVLTGVVGVLVGTGIGWWLA